jgi:hypothetical protein
MRSRTPKRLRALGIVLLEALGLGLIVADKLGDDVEFRHAITAFLKKVRSL